MNKSVNQENSRFDAFISYNRKDKTFAARLEKTLEGYKPPKTLSVPQRTFNIFRDEEDMIGTRYYHSIDNILKRSSKLIVICSRNSRKSKYVNDEIKRFVRTKSAIDIIPVLIDGFPDNETKIESEKAFPNALSEVMKDVPLAKDYRDFDISKHEINKTPFKNEWYGLLAELYNKNRRDIEERDRKAQIRRQRIRYSIVLALTIAITIAFYSSYQALVNKRITRSKNIAALALDQLSANPDLSILLSLEALNIQGTFESEDALRQSLFAYPTKAILRGHEGPVLSAHFSPDGKKIVTTSIDLTSRLWEASTGRELAILRGHSSSFLSALFPTSNSNFQIKSQSLTSYGWEFKTDNGLIRFDRYTNERLLLESGGDIVAVSPGPLNDNVFSAQFSPNGKFIVTTSWDSTARVWDVDTGKEVAILHGHNGSILSVQFSPDSKKIVSASTDATARLWDASAGKPLRVFRGHQAALNNAQFSHDGNRIVTSSFDMTSRIWNSTTGEEIRALHGHTKGVLNAEFSYDGKEILTVGDDATCRIWKASSGEAIAELRGQVGEIRRARFSPNGKQVVVAGDFNTAWIWNIKRTEETEENVHALEHSESVHDVRFSPDGQFVITTSSAGKVIVWEVKTKQSRVVLRGHKGIAFAAEFSPDGKQIVSAGIDATARLIGKGNRIELVKLVGHRKSVIDSHFSPDGSKVLTASLDTTARIWDVNTGEELAVLRGHTQPIHIIRFLPNGNQVLTASLDTTARVWDVLTSEEVLVFREFEEPITNVDFSPDGKQMLTTSYNLSPHLWEVATATKLTSITGLPGKLLSTNYSSSGINLLITIWSSKTGVWEIFADKAGWMTDRIRESFDRFSIDSILNSKSYSLPTVAELTPKQSLILLSGQNYYVVSTKSLKSRSNPNLNGSQQEWDFRTSDLLSATHMTQFAEDRLHSQPRLTNAQFSKDGQKVFVVNDGSDIRVWEITTGKDLALFESYGARILSIRFSPDGNKIVTGNENGTAIIWDINTGKKIAVLTHHRGAARLLEFSPDGKKVVTGGQGPSVIIWDAQTGEKLTVLEEHRGMVRSLRFSPNGKKLVIGCDDNLAYLYLVDVKDLIELARSRVGRKLTSEERITYLN